MESHVEIGADWIHHDPAQIVHEAGAKTDRRAMAFTDAPGAHDEPTPSGFDSALIGVANSGRVGESGALHRELVREVGTDQTPSVVAEVDGRIEATGHAMSVQIEPVVDVVVTSVEAQ